MVWLSVLIALLRECCVPSVNNRTDAWAQHPGICEFQYNCSVQASGGFSPFYLNYGQEPAVPSTMLVGHENPVPAVLDCLQGLERGLGQA